MKTHESHVIPLEFALGLCISSLVGFATAALLMLLIVLLPANAQAQTEMETGTVPTVPVEWMRLQDVQGGTLLYAAAEGEFHRVMPQLHTRVLIQVNGGIARTRVQQVFHNATPDWQEGLYVFPLPESAAVDQMRMKIGERIIEGEIREKQQARKLYEQARREGKKATLLQQERPNVFTNSVANIAPGEEVMIEIEYQEVLRYQQAIYSLRFPLVVGPRYIPGRAVSATPGSDADRFQPLPAAQGSGWAPDTDQVPDASRITRPVLPAASSRKNTVTIEVSLRPGFPLQQLRSPYHAIDVQTREQGDMRVVLRDGQVIANRDFVLEWQPQTGHLPEATVFSEQTEAGQYAMLIIQPPNTNAQQVEYMRREVIYVIDTSGSMAGTSIEQARRALQLAVQELQPRDRFNIIEFNSVSRRFFPSTVPADASSVQYALQQIGQLHANGGTEMLPALQAALGGPVEDQAVRQVIFITDGNIGNEQQLFHEIQSRLGGSRLFTVGIGSAPNSHFMSRAARLGRGSYTYIGKVEEVQEKMAGLFTRLSAPVLTDIRLQWPGGQVVESWPAANPDVYAGEPIVVASRVQSLEGELIVSGRLANTAWEKRITLGRWSRAEGIGRLWARHKIAELLDRMHMQGETDALRQEITHTALAHHLVSKYTSLVAVDKTPSRPQGQSLRTSNLPTHLPAGWQYHKVFGGLPQTGTDSYWKMLLGSLCILAAVFLGRLSGSRRSRTWPGKSC